MMLHQARNVWFVFQHKNGLAQPVCPLPGGRLVSIASGRTES
jgi:hypothetical protein